MQSVATNHPFVDGNKRTSILLVELLLSQSGYRLEPLPGEDDNRLVEDFVADCVVGGHWPIERIAEWFKERLRPAAPG
jgi:prophage maintenance system killer protein